MYDFSIDLVYYEEDKTFFGTSDNIPGLIIETHSFEEFMKEANWIVPYLISENLGIQSGTINVSINSKNAKPAKSEKLSTNYQFKDTVLAMAM